MKKTKYTRKQITEAIKHWKKVLKRLNETNDQVGRTNIYNGVFTVDKVVDTECKVIEIQYGDGYHSLDISSLLLVKQFNDRKHVQLIAEKLLADVMDSTVSNIKVNSEEFFNLSEVKDVFPNFTYEKYQQWINSNIQKIVNFIQTGESTNSISIKIAPESTEMQLTIVLTSIESIYSDLT